MIKRNPREEAYERYDASGSESSEDTGFDLLSTPRDEFGMRIVLNPTAAAAACVIQKGWREHLQRRSLPGCPGDRNQILERLLGQTHAEPERVIGDTSSDDADYDPNNQQCPDGLPGCTCGSAQSIAWHLTSMWRNLQLGDLTAQAARVIQRDWKMHLQRRQLLLRRKMVLEMRSPIEMLLPLHGPVTEAENRNVRAGQARPAPRAT